MRYTTFGKTGHRVSSLGFGAMNLPGKPLEQSRQALNYALDNGINYIDTASAYRDSEEILGACISHRRSEFFLATKARSRDYAGAKAEIERSLQRLRTDCVDLLQLHYVNYTSEFNEIMGENGAYRAALEMKREGKVRFIGITGHRPELLAKWVGKGQFDQVLFHLSLVQRFALDELIPAAESLDMGRTAMKPLSGGFVQPVDKAIRYPYSQNVHTLISGMTTVEEVKMNIAAQDREMDDGERAELEELAGQWSAHNCRRCNYCSCPVGIAIPDVMISSEIRKSGPLLPRGEAFYANNREKLVSCAEYEPCRDTPQCESKCPYHLPMASVIRAAAATL